MTILAIAFVLVFLLVGVGYLRNAIAGLNPITVNESDGTVIECKTIERAERIAFIHAIYKKVRAEVRQGGKVVYEVHHTVE